MIFFLLLRVDFSKNVDYTMISYDFFDLKLKPHISCNPYVHEWTFIVIFIYNYF